MLHQITDESINIIASRFIDWHLNLLLASWYGGFFESLVKDLSIKDLQGNRIS